MGVMLCLLGLLLAALPVFGQVIQEDEERNLCQITYTTGYGYRHYIHLPDSSRLSNGSVLFKFEVMATSDAHVLLSPVSSPGDSDPIYEVVIGAGRNSFSDIRRLRVGPARKSVLTKGILSETSLKKFWIMADKSILMVGEEGVEPFLVWNVNSSIEVNYLSFCSWTGFDAKWKFDCKGATPVAEKKTVSARLKQELFASYDPYSVPTTDDDDMEIDANLHIDYIHLEAATSSMQIRGQIILTWFDPNLQWEPEKYENITVMRITQKEIWLPQLMVYNSAEGPNKGPVVGGLVRMSYAGVVSWQAALSLDSLCPLTFDNWPSDSHSCPVYLGLAPHQQSVRVVVSKAKPITKGERANMKEWRLESLVAETKYRRTPWSAADDEANETAVLTLRAGLVRHPAPLHHLLYVPVIVAMFISCCSLMLQPECEQRVYLQAILMVMIVVMLVCIDYALPASSFISATPYIMKLCSHLVLVNMFCLLETIWLCIGSSKEAVRPLPEWLHNLVNSSTINFSSLSINSRRRGEANEDMGEEILGSSKRDTTAEVTWAALMKFMDRFLLAFVLMLYAILLML